MPSQKELLLDPESIDYYYSTSMILGAGRGIHVGLAFYYFRSAGTNDLKMATREARRIADEFRSVVIVGADMDKMTSDVESKPVFDYRTLGLWRRVASGDSKWLEWIDSRRKL